MSNLPLKLERKSRLDLCHYLRDNQLHLFLYTLDQLTDRDNRIDGSSACAARVVISLASLIRGRYSRPDRPPIVQPLLPGLRVSLNYFIIIGTALRIVPARPNDGSSIILPWKDICSLEDIMPR